MTLMRNTAAVIASWLVLSGFPARADVLPLSPASAPAADSLAGACRDDTEKYCGSGATQTLPVTDCLQQHSVDLSSGCRATITPVKPAWQAELDQTIKNNAACKKDIEAFCEGVQVGEGRIENCLKAHRKKLSKACRDVQPGK
jgi:hypothetical protein